MLYKQVQFIAHCLYTAPNHVWDSTDKIWKDEYNGLADTKADIAKRLDLVKVVIQVAAKERAVSKEPEVLKIFMMPECFFQGKNGAYPITDVATVIEQLQDLVKDSQWRDWIFVFGTINGVYEVGTFEEIVNIVLVQKGGYGDLKSAPNHCFLIQKARFSLDLLDIAHLQGTGLVADKVGFGTTQNEELLVKLVHKILADDQQDRVKKVFEQEGGEVGGWHKLKTTLEKELAQRGDTNVVRVIRSIKMPLDLSWDKDWMPVAKKLVVDSARKLKNYRPLHMYSDSAKFKEVIAALVDDSNSDEVKIILKALSFPEARWNAMKTRLIEALDNDNLREGIFNSVRLTPDTKVVWDTDWIGAVKKLLDLYVITHGPIEIYEVKSAPRIDIKKKDELLSAQTKEAFHLDDYKFKFVDVKKLKDEELTFGLEICADHGEGRLKSALSSTKPPSAPVDIHLIASAGMCIDDKSIAARSKGYVFSCDGWNIPGARSSGFRGTGVEVTFSHLDGGSETFKPHSEVRKVDDSEEFLALAVDLDDSLAASIFPKGAGQLHIYGSVNL